MPRNIVRSFGLAGHRYEVSERGLLYQRLAWLCAFGIPIFLFAGDFHREALPACWTVAGLLLFATSRFVRLVPRHGRRLKRAPAGAGARIRRTEIASDAEPPLGDV